MSKKKTLLSCIKHLIYGGVVTVMVAQAGYAQMDYVYPHLVSGQHVDNPTNVQSADNSYAKVNSYGGLALGLGAYNGKLEMTFPSTIPANQETFVRLDFNHDVLNAILGGGLGTALADILGNVLLGDHFFDVRVLNGNTERMKVLSNNLANFNERARIVQNQHGHYLLALKPNASYNKITFEDKTRALLLSTTNHTKVYTAYTKSGSDPCNQDLHTYNDANGGVLTLDVLGLARGGVTDAYKVIDTDPNSFSEISLGLLAVAGEISQTIKLETPLESEMQFHLTMQVGNPALLQLGLNADAIKVQALHNGSVVYEKPVNKDYLSLDLLGLLNNSQKARIPFYPGVAFDEVRIVLKSTVDLNLTKTTKIYDIQFSTYTAELDIEACGSVSLRDAIPNLQDGVAYEFFDMDGNPLSAELANNITTSGVYQIKGVEGNGFCPNDRVTVNVNVLPLPTLEVQTPNSALSVGESITLSATSDSTLTWYDQSGAVLTNLTVGPFQTAGSHTYTVVADNGECSNTNYVHINVIDPDDCPPLIARNYASRTSWGSIITGGVSNQGNATDGNPQTYSTITTGLGLLGIGTTWQTLQWDHTIPAGTPVTIKLGPEYSLLSLAGGISVVGTKRNSLGHAIDVGVLKPVSGELLKLLPGQNIVEYTFVPSTISGAKNYDGVRISIGALLSVAQNAKVYGAYYHEVANQMACDGKDIQDILYGVVDLGIGALTSTVGVDHAWNVADKDENTFAIMYAGVNVLAATEMTAVFHTPSQVGDTLRIDVSKPGSVLSLALIKGLEIQRYLGNAKVGEPIHSDFNFLDLKILSNGTARIHVAPQEGVYDRVSIRLGGVVNVLDFLRIHEISRTAATKIIGSDLDNSIEVCQGQEISFDIIDDCTTYKWYDAAKGGQVLGQGNTYTIPVHKPAGTYKLYIQPIRYGCENYERTEVTVVVKEGTPADAVLNVTVNGGQDMEICTDSGNLTLQALVDTNLVDVEYFWYQEENGQVSQLPNANSATITLQNLGTGNHVYYLGLSAEGYCETNVDDRYKIEFTIKNTGSASAITVNGTEFCLTDAVLLTPTSTIVPATFNWYFSNNKTQPIHSGMVVNGVTYTIDATGKLGVEGLTSGTYSYYVSVLNTNTCENADGDLKAAVIVVSDAPTPTTNQTTQAFCAADAPKVSDLQVSGTNVTWYLTAQGGTPLAATTLLVNGVYYASSSVGTCESAVRLKVTVNLSQGELLTGSGAQTFCAADRPTVSNIVTNQIGAKWYSSLNGGTILSDSTALVDGTTYYGVLGGGTSCESATRLSVTVSIQDVTTPTTTATTQSFCATEAPTVADLQASGTAVRWYAVQEGGIALAPTTPLVNGNKYYAVSVSVGCESSVRLEVSVRVTNPATPTTSHTTQSFCSVNNPTVGAIQVNQNNVKWYQTATGGTEVPASTALVNGTTYYAVLVSSEGCESATRLAVQVQIVDVNTPTTSNTSQVFCKVDQPTVGSIAVNESGVKWYTAATGGTALPSNTALVSGTYYGAIAQAGCESDVRLVVQITVNDVPTPTAVETYQIFCAVDQPTVADLQANEANVKWFTSATGGTILDSTVALVSGTTYFAALIQEGCESTTRLAVAVAINDEVAPTTNAVKQSFCESAGATVADLVTFESNVVWYLSETGGTALVDHTLLKDNTVYYGALKGASCESSVRLAIEVHFYETQQAILEGEFEVCLGDSYTYRTSDGMKDYVWTIQGGTIVDGGNAEDDYVTVIWDTLGGHTLAVDYTDLNGCATSSLFEATVKVILCSDLAIAMEVDNREPIVDEQVTFKVTIANIGTTDFTDVEVRNVLPNGYTLVSATTHEGTYAGGAWIIPFLSAETSTFVTVVAKVNFEGDYLNVAEIITSNPIDLNADNNRVSVEVTPHCLTIYNEFSPNNDGSNDFFKIDCIEYFDNNRIEIYNRLGSLVYSTTNYKNDWNGIANVSGTMGGKEVPDGTYYYVLDLGNGVIKKGWLYIIR